MSSGIEKVLSAMVVLHASFGIEEPPKKRVMSMARINSSTFPSMVSRMAKKGLIEYGSASGTLKLTEMGRNMAPDDHDCATSNEETHEEIKKKLRGKALAIFEVLADGKAHRKEDVMELVDCTNPKTFAPLLSRELKRNGYIEYPSKGFVQLSKMCFPFDRDEEA